MPASPLNHHLFSSCDIKNIGKTLSRFRICIYFHNFLLQNCNSYFPCNPFHANVEGKQRASEILSAF